MKYIYAVVVHMEKNAKIVKKTFSFYQEMAQHTPC